KERAIHARDDILTEMVRGADAGQVLTLEQVVNSALALILAGHETLVTGLTNFLFFLSKSDPWRKRLIEEQATLETRGLPITSESLRQMPDLLNAVKETLRWPVASVVFRVCDHEVAIGGYRVPAGWIIAPNFTGAHFDPDFWRDPTRWEPSRFEGNDERRD